MKAIEYVPFNENMIPDAGKLLSERHARNRKALPILPARFEDSQLATKAVESLWNKKWKSGYAAFSKGRMIGYLIGDTSTQPWGRSGYAYLAGYALAKEASPAVFQDLYSLLGEDWVKKGNFNHYLYISAAEPELHAAVVDMGFGKERVDALMDFGSVDIPDVEEPTGVNIRQAGKGDNAFLGSLSDVIARALAEPPYWHPTMPEDWPDLYEGWAELADDSEFTVWLALRNDEALGTAGFMTYAESDADMLIWPKTAYLTVAATKPEARGHGVSTVLTWHGLQHAQEAGFTHCYSNWISPNLLASRFWPRFGFQDVAYRYAKKISPMIAWSRYA